MSDVKVQYHEGSPWFWKIFGGAIIGLVSILLLSHLTNINNTIDRSFIDLRTEIKELRQHNDAQKERILALEQGGYRDKIATLDKSVAALQVGLDGEKTKAASNEAAITAMKEEIRTLREWNKELGKRINELNEKVTTLSATQKSVEKK